MTADLARLRGLLSRLDECWRRVGAPVLEVARPGLLPDQIDEMTAPLGRRLPVEVREWFAWREGVPPELAHQATMGPSFFLPSLEGCVAAYADERQFAATAYTQGWADTPDWLFAESWFPMFNRIRARSLAIIEMDVPDGDAAPLGELDKDSVDPPGEGRTLTELVSFWVSCHEEGLYQWQPETLTWQADLDAAADIDPRYCNLYM